MTLRASLIGVSLTNGHMQAWVYDPEGEVISSYAAAEVQTGDGTERVTAGLNAWLPDLVGRCPILVSGGAEQLSDMSGPFRMRVPFRMEDIGSHVIRRQDMFFIPGLLQPSPPDLTCGTETSLFGIDQTDGLVCMPGGLTVHYRLETGRIAEFSTEMSGEVLSSIMSSNRTASLALPQQVFEEQVFVEWAERSLDTENALSAYSVHAASLTGSLAPGLYQCALSGLLIGADVAAHYDPGDDVILIADEENLNRYGLVFDALDADVLEYAAEECLSDGLWEIAELAGLLAD